MMIWYLNVVDDACNLWSTKYNILWHLRLHLEIELLKMCLDLKVDQYLGWTIDISH